jgi:hypothetical protein
VSSTQWMPGQVVSFFSHWSPVCLSVIVPFGLSTKRGVVVVVVLVVVLVVADVVLVVAGLVVVVVAGGAAHSPSLPQNPLQHWRFCVQLARFGLQLALLGSVPALGVATRSVPTTARSRSSVGVIRVASLSSRDIFFSFRRGAARPERYYGSGDVRPGVVQLVD